MPQRRKTPNSNLLNSALKINFVSYPAHAGGVGKYIYIYIYICTLTNTHIYSYTHSHTYIWYVFYEVILNQNNFTTYVHISFFLCVCAYIYMGILVSPEKPCLIPTFCKRINRTQPAVEIWVRAFEERDERFIRATKFIYNNNNKQGFFYTKWNKQRMCK